MSPKRSASRVGKARSSPPRGQAREALMEAAARLAREHGMVGLSIERIVAAAGLSKGAFFHHFESRQAMVAALIAHLAEEFDGDLAQRQTSGDSVARVYVETMLDDLERGGGFIYVLATAAADDATLGALVLERTQAFAQRMIEEGMESSRAFLVRACVDGLVMQCVLRAGAPPEPTAMAETRRALDALLRAS